MDLFKRDKTKGKYYLEVTWVGTKSRKSFIIKYFVGARKTKEYLKSFLVQLLEINMAKGDLSMDSYGFFKD